MLLSPGEGGNMEPREVLGQLYKLLDLRPGESLVSEEQPDEVYQTRFFREAKQKLGADAIFFFKPRGSSVSVPYIYFRRLEANNPADVSVEIARLHKLAWNMGRAPLLFVALPTGEIRIYNTYESPHDPVPGVEYRKGLIESLNIFAEAEEARKLLLDYHRREFESGRYWATHGKRFDPRKQAHNTLLARLKITRRRLIDVLSENMPETTSAEIVHSLLGRSIFIKYLEDRRDSSGKNVFPDGFFSDFHSGATDFTEVLPDKDATYRLFEYLENKFNGDLFPISETEKDNVSSDHLLRLKEFLVGDRELESGQLSLWKDYSFDVIPIEFVSNLYEEFFHSQVNLGKSVKAETHYTPHHLVEFLVDEVFPWDGQEIRYATLDPACGSGIFLVEMYRRIIAHWFQANPDSATISPAQLSALLVENIFGVDSNLDAVRVAAFSLHLTMCDFLEPRQIWEEVRFAKLYGTNLFHADFFEENKGFAQRKYDLIIGNPPWKSELTLAAKQYCEQTRRENPHREVAPDSQIAIAFLWRAAELCRQEGRICLIMPSKGLLFNRSNTYRAFRKEFLETYEVSTVVNFSVIRRTLFGKAAGPAAAIFYTPSKPNDEKPILYCTPKPSYSLRDAWQFIIDSQDIALLPRVEVREDDVMWKVAMWGGPRDYALIKRLGSQAYTSIGRVCKERKWVPGEGIIVGEPMQRTHDASWLFGKPYVDAHELGRFAMDESMLRPFEIRLLQRPRTRRKEIFLGPHLLVKQSPSAGEPGFRAVLLKKDTVFRHSLLGINAPVTDLHLLAKYCIALNSRVPLYFAMLYSGRWLVERDELDKEEVLNLPMPTAPFNEPIGVNTLSDLAQDPNWENRVSQIVMPAYGLSEDEQILVDDAVEYTLSFFRQKDESKAVEPTFSKDNGEQVLRDYLEIMIRTLEKSFGNPFTATIFDNSRNSPLRIVEVRLVTTDETLTGRVSITSNPNLDAALRKVDRFLRDIRQPNVFIQRVVKAYIGRATYVIKPDQQRYWTRASALRDADEMYEDIMRAWRSQA